MSTRYEAWAGPEELAAEADEPGGISRAKAYQVLLTAEGKEAFERGGFIVNLDDPQQRPALIRNREAVAADVAEWLPSDAAERCWRAAYAGLTEYRVPEREAGS